MENQPISPKKQRIINAAATLFRKRGYPATSMRDLAEVVDLKASSLYSHIGSKEELLRQMCFENAERFRDGMTAVKTEHSAPVERIQALLHFHLQMAIDHRSSVTVFNDEWRHLSSPFLEEFLILRKAYERDFQSIIADGIAAGQIRPLEPQIILVTLLSALRWVYDAYKPERGPAPEILKAQLSELVLRGLFV